MFVFVTTLTQLITSAAVPVAKSVTLKSDNGEIKVRASDDIKDLFDGDKVWSADGKANFDQDGIVLIQNTKAETPNYYPTCNLIIDLGEEKSIDTVDVTFYHYYMAIIDTPKDGKIVVSYSVDGKSFSEIKTHTMTKKAVSGTAGIIDEKISLGKVYKAKAVMISMTYGDYPQTKPVNEWFGFTEISAGLAADYKGESAPTSSVANSSASSAASSSTTSPADSSVASDIISNISSTADETTSVTSLQTSSQAVSSKVSSSAASAPGSTNEGMGTWAIVAIAVVAAAAIAGIIYYIVKRNKNNV